MAAVEAARVADFAALAVLLAAALVVLLAGGLAALLAAALVVGLAGRFALDPVFGGMVETPCWILARRSLPVGFGRLARRVSGETLGLPGLLVFRRRSHGRTDGGWGEMTQNEPSAPVAASRGRSRRITLDEWRHRPLWERIQERFAWAMQKQL